MAGPTRHWLGPGARAAWCAKGMLSPWGISFLTFLASSRCYLALPARRWKRDVPRECGLGRRGAGEQGAGSRPVAVAASVVAGGVANLGPFTGPTESVFGCRPSRICRPAASSFSFGFGHLEMRDKSSTQGKGNHQMPCSICNDSFFSRSIRYDSPAPLSHPPHQDQIRPTSHSPNEYPSPFRSIISRFYY
jgi:hypothetical protein